MAEIIGVVASGMAVLQLADAVLKATQKLFSTLKTVTGTPKMIGETLKEIGLMGKIIQDIKFDDTAQGLSSLGEALDHCAVVVDEFDEMITRLNQGLGRGKLSRHWTGLKVACKGRSLDDIMERLERAKSMLGLAINGYSMRMQSQHAIMLTSLMSSPLSISADGVEKQRHTVTSISVSETHNLGQQRQETRTRCTTSRWWSFGWCQSSSSVFVKQIDGHGNTAEHETISTWTFLPAAWIRLRGISAIQKHAFGQWQYSLAFFRIVPDKAPVLQACAKGDLEEVINLIRSGSASIFDVSEDGWTLLHVAAAHLRPELCRWLIRNGTRTDAIECYGGSTPLHVAADQSGRGGPNQIWKKSGVSFKDAVNNFFRPSDAIDTIRILVEIGSCDPMLETQASTWAISHGYMYQQSALHLYTGPIEGFEYLIKQEHFVCDLKAKNGDNYDVGLEQLFRGPAIVTAYEFTRLCLQRPSQVNRRHPRFCNMANLHFLAGRLTETVVNLNNVKPLFDTMAWLLVNGEDVHAVNDLGHTPLQKLIQMISTTTSIRHKVVIYKSWFRTLRDSGFDIQCYIWKELGFWERWTSQHSPKLERRYLSWFQAKIIPGTADMILTLGFPIRMRRHYNCRLPPSMGVPGSRIDSIEECEHERKPTEAANGFLSFIVGPLENKVQEFDTWHFC